MLEAIARLAIRAPRRIIAIALLVMVGTAVFGIPVANSLSAGGFQDPTADSAHAAQLLAGKFDQGDMQMLITVSSDDGAQSGAARAVGTDIVRQLHELALCGAGDFAMDRTAVGGEVAGQQGRQHRADRRGHHRRCRTAHSSTPRRSATNWCTTVTA